jgi:hypothetical protein
VSGLAQDPLLLTALVSYHMAGPQGISNNTDLSPHVKEK